MPLSELIARAAIPAVLVVALLGFPVALWWEKRRPTVPEHVAELRAWRSLSTAEQAAADREEIAVAAFEESEADVVHRAEESARFAAEMAARTNVLYHP